MRKFTWLLALAIPVTIISCQKDAVQAPANEDEALVQGNAVDGQLTGAHYNLNIIGVKNPKTFNYDEAAQSNTTGNGHVIFVDQSGRTRINLLPSETYDFDVTDANGTDGIAAFTLPNPDPEGDGTTTYSVFARVPGNQKGSVEMTTCADGIVLDADGDGILEPGEQYAVTLDCDGITFDSDNFKKFTNVSAELLYVTLQTDAWFDLDGDKIRDANEIVKAGRYPIFDENLFGFFWDYNNDGLKLLQLRFYPITSTVDVDPIGGYDDTTW